MRASAQTSLPLSRESTDVTSQCRSWCLEFLDSRVRGNDEWDIFEMKTERLMPTGPETRIM